MAKPIHVVPHANGWATRHEGAGRAGRVTTTQEAAIDIARAASRREGAELVIHGRNGQIRSKDSHGHDPYPPKG